MAYEKRPVVTSPVGTTGWTCINKPSVKFKPEGEYSIELVLPADVAGPLQQSFHAAAVAAQQKFLGEEKDAKKLVLLKKFTLFVPGSPELDEAGNETGNTSFKFKATALIKPKDKSKAPFEKKVGIFDAQGAPIPPSVIVGRGSRVKVAYEVMPFKNDATKQIGVSLRLQAVQVIHLVRYGGEMDAKGYGFGAEEGYTHAPEDQSPVGDQPSTDASPETQPSGNGDF